MWKIAASYKFWYMHDWGCNDLSKIRKITSTSIRCHLAQNLKWRAFLTTNQHDLWISLYKSSIAELMAYY